MLYIHGYAVTLGNVLAFTVDFVLHMLVGYILVDYATTRVNPLWGALGGLLPNLDTVLSLWPNQPPLFVHRGIMHTPVFVGVLVLLLGWKYPRVMVGIGIGWLAELGLDIFESHDGIMLAYPLSTHHYAIPIPEMPVWIPGVFVVLGLITVLHWETHGHPSTGLIKGV